MREDHEPCVDDWRETIQARIDRAYAPLLPPDDALRRAVVAEIRHENALRPIPDPVCRDCGYPIVDESDRDPLYKRRCSLCGPRKLGRLIERLRRRLGRKGTIKALKILAKGK